MKTTDGSSRCVVLNESGKSCGERGGLKGVFSLGSFDQSVEYVVELDTIEQNDEANPENSSTGRLRHPVRSVGKIGRDFFFATDLRFANWPGAERITPTTAPELVLDIRDRPGGVEGILRIEGEPDDVIRTGILKDKGLVMETLSVWSQAHRETFSIPEEVLGYAPSLDAESAKTHGGAGLVRRSHRPDLY